MALDSTVHFWHYQQKIR